VAGALAGATHAQEANYYYFGSSAGQSNSQMNVTNTTNSPFGAGVGAALQGHEQQDTAYKIVGVYLTRTPQLQTAPSVRATGAKAIP
jgi:hypothetical protein